MGFAEFIAVNEPFILKTMQIFLALGCFIYAWRGYKINRQKPVVVWELGENSNKRWGATVNVINKNNVFVTIENFVLVIRDKNGKRVTEKIRTEHANPPPYVMGPFSEFPTTINFRTLEDFGYARIIGFGILVQTRGYFFAKGASARNARKRLKELASR
jgi:hypothetical protein